MIELSVGKPSKNWAESKAVVVWDSRKSVVRKERIESSSPVELLFAIGGGRGEVEVEERKGQSKEGENHTLAEAFSRTFLSTLALDNRAEAEGSRQKTKGL